LLRRNRAYLLTGLALLILLIFFGNRIATLYTEWLWFSEMNQRVVFTKVFGTRLLLFLVFGAASFVLAYINVTLADRLSPPATIRTAERDDLYLARNDHRPVGRAFQAFSFFRHILDVMLLLGALVFGILAGSSAQAEWASFLRLTSPVVFGRTDPLFEHDIGYYIFTLPFIRFTQGWLLTVLLLLIAGVALIYVYQQIVNSPAERTEVQPHVRAHLSGLLALALLVKAWGYYLDRFDLMYRSGAFPGAGYTDVHVRLPLLGIMIWATIVAALIVAWNIRKRTVAIPISVVCFWFLLSGSGVVIPAIIQQARVIPNEAERESPFIERAIAATRGAYNLESVRVEPFPADERLTAASLVRERSTFSNIRLWDSDPMLEILPQQQAVRRYYGFPRVHVDRYPVGDGYQAVMVAVREFLTEGLDMRAQTWPNLRLRYTHGFGAVMSPLSGVTAEGLPRFVVRDMPPTSDIPGVSLTQPRVYFGMGSLPSDYIVVGTGQAEFDYPSVEAAGATDHVNRYDGRAGIRLTPLTRAMFALRFASGSLLLSQQFSSASRIILHRRVANRVKRLAPFLLLDNDPYPVLTNGRIVWMQDAYTTSEAYPYSAMLEGGDNLSPAVRFNYIRHSVTATVDAYDGTVTLYAVDDSDPLLQCYQEVFPGLFQPASAMPEAIKAHRRFAKDLFSVQRRILADYHGLDPTLYYSRTDSWQTLAGRHETSRMQSMTPLDGGDEAPPYFVLTRLPGEVKEEFVLVSPFTPRGRENMIALLVARCDGERNGERILYRFSQSNLVYGPEHIRKRIRSDSRVSPYLSLMDQKGSRIRFGPVRVIPIDTSVLFLQSLYVMGQTGGEEERVENALPELKQVIVAYGNRIAMQPTLNAALTEIFDRDGDGWPDADAESLSSLIARASALYDRAQNALKAGDFAGYGRESKALGETLRRLRQRSRAPSEPSGKGNNGNSAGSSAGSGRTGETKP
jgi:uncharacterized membrane protein (UPF0182 family)